jgi:hypothetical protein
MTDISEAEAITRYLRPFTPGDTVVSYLTAALRDAQTAFDTGAAFWLASIGYLIAVEQIGHTIRTGDSSDVSARRGSRVAFAAAMSDLGDPALEPEEIDALYDMRCALAHEFGLRNKPVNEKWTPRVFTFRQSGSLIVLPSAPWDRTLDSARRADMTTTVNVHRVRAYVEALVARARQLHVDQRLRLVQGVTAEEVVGLLAFQIL